MSDIQDKKVKVDFTIPTREELKSNFSEWKQIVEELQFKISSVETEIIFETKKENENSKKTLAAIESKRNEQLAKGRVKHSFMDTFTNIAKQLKILLKVEIIYDEKCLTFVTNNWIVYEKEDVYISYEYLIPNANNRIITNYKNESF